MTLSPPRTAQRVFKNLQAVGSQHPSPDVNNFEPQTWLDTVTSRDAKSAYFQRLKTSRDVMLLGVFPFWLKTITSGDGCVLLLLKTPNVLQL